MDHNVAVCALMVSTRVDDERSKICISPVLVPMTTYIRLRERSTEITTATRTYWSPGRKVQHTECPHSSVRTQDVVRVFHIFSEPESVFTTRRTVGSKKLPFEADARRVSSELSASVLTSVL